MPQRRHADVIGILRVIGLRPAVADIGLQICEEFFCVFDPLHGSIARLRLRLVVGGQTFNLLDVEHGVTLHEVDFVIGFIPGRIIRLLAGDGIGVNHE